MNWRRLGDGFEYANPIRYNEEYRQVEMERETTESDSETDALQWEDESELSGIFSSYLIKHSHSNLKMNIFLL